MNDLVIEGTVSSPTVKGEWQSGTLYMEGDSYPENSYELFGSMTEWITRYLQESDQPLTVELKLLYLNTSSIKVMMDMFDDMEAAFQDGRKVAVNWYFDAENERVAELAEEFKEDCTFPFSIVGK
ncbi:biofilm regulation phosphoprotein SiaC [Marinomonas algarum]|uniref:Biofilm regulation phosphoprotein SiaC n=1 Tax=Marinomonas algarum TaxID=2883105 RepID=A0A9X1IN63_9GAMM|nr:biofilm regulation phosphoprotein SiaC [Marinomonas algarum]MCB5161101.1 biofilm regulation phosphoprotein SiaC [Marinomonas algarum]